MPVPVLVLVLVLVLADDGCVRRVTGLSRSFDACRAVERG